MGLLFCDLDRFKVINEGWGYDDVLDYFRRSERNGRGASKYHGGDGPLSVSDLADPNPLTMRLLDAAPRCRRRSRHRRQRRLQR